MTLDKVDRQNLIRTGVTLSAGALIWGPVATLLECLEGSETARSPKRVGATDIAQIRNTARVFESWHCTYGGGRSGMP